MTVMAFAATLVQRGLYKVKQRLERTCVSVWTESLAMCAADSGRWTFAGGPHALQR